MSAPLSPATQALLDTTIADAGLASDADASDATAQTALQTATSAAAASSTAKTAAHAQVTIDFKAFANALATDLGQPLPFSMPGAAPRKK